MIVSLGIVSCKASVPKQKMSGKDLDGLINKTGTLVINQSVGIFFQILIISFCLGNQSKQST
jgi:hypothetical protein